MAGSKVFSSNLCDYFGLYANCILGATGEEMPSDKVINTPLVRLHAAALCRLNRMDGCMCLIILVSHFGLHELSLLH